MSNQDHKVPPQNEFLVGFGRPPIASRFEPGRSGNPKGRPKASKNFSTLFAEELAQPVVLNEDGRRKRMSKRQALAKQLVNKALSNEPKAAGLVLDQIRRTEGSDETSAAVKFDRRVDALAIDSIIRRIRMAEEPSAIVDEPGSESDKRP